MTFGLGLHMQNSVPDWWRVTENQPEGHEGATKLVFGVQRGKEVRSGLVWYRWVGDQPLPDSDFENHCEAWIRQFVDDSFALEARHIDLVSGYNETLANSQGPDERWRWIQLHTAMAKVWKERFRDVPYVMQDGKTRVDLSHIRITICATAVGNDIPIEIARAVQKYDAVLDYHPYTPCRVGKVIGEHPDTPDSGINRPSWVSPHAWRWYDGRWAYMDEAFRAAGVLVNWIFGELGPVLDQSEIFAGHLDPLGGWKSPDCLANSVTRYREWLRYWLDNATLTHAYKTNRLISANLFTTGAPGDGQWDLFELRDGDMMAVFDEAKRYPYPEQGTPPPPPPPPPPKCEPRVQYKRRYRVMPGDIGFEHWMAICADAYWTKESVGGSYDDAGLWGGLDDRTAILFGIDEADMAEYTQWYNDNYPGAKLEWEDLPHIGRNPGVELGTPVAGNPSVSQHYGENYTLYMMRYGIPGHNGIDWAVPIGTNVYQAAAGAIADFGYDLDAYGKYVKVDHGDGLETIYAHLDSIANIKIGTWYDRGRYLGKSGNTGWSSGPHLHFGVKVDGRYRDPATWLA